MQINSKLVRATLTGALGGLLFGFDTVVIAGAIDALVRLYGLSPQGKGLTVAIGLVGTVVGPVYIAELAPAKWRGRLVGTFQFNVVFGIVLAYVSNYAIRTLHLGAAEWRWQVGVAALPAVAFLALLFGIPRSPRWSASHNRIDDALAVLKMMGEPNPQAELDDIRSALAQEHAT